MIMLYHESALSYTTHMPFTPISSFMTQLTSHCKKRVKAKSSGMCDFFFIFLKVFFALYTVQPAIKGYRLAMLYSVAALYRGKTMCQ